MATAGGLGRFPDGIGRSTVGRFNRFERGAVGCAANTMAALAPRHRARMSGSAKRLRDTHPSRQPHHWSPDQFEYCATMSVPLKLSILTADSMCSGSRIKQTGRCSHGNDFRLALVPALTHNCVLADGRFRLNGEPHGSKRLTVSPFIGRLTGECQNVAVKLVFVHPSATGAIVLE